MRFQEFLAKVVDESIVAATRDYADKPHKKHYLEGSVAGLNACRDKSPPQLALLLERARNARNRAMAQKTVLKRYWRVSCFANEVEWVCNVVSAVLLNQGLPIIVEPTSRGLMMAARITNGEASLAPTN